MLTSKKVKKKRGRRPPKYGPYRCPLCYEKLKLRASGSLTCECGWKE